MLLAPSSLKSSHEKVDGFDISFSPVPGASEYEILIVAKHNISDSESRRQGDTAAKVCCTQAILTNWREEYDFTSNADC